MRPPDLSSSSCFITGRSVNVGLHPSSGTAASSPLNCDEFSITIYLQFNLDFFTSLLEVWELL
jgi:hypothetical protein